MHWDHYTQAVAIKRQFGTAISLGDGERPSIDVVTGRIAQSADASFSDRLARADAERIRREWDETVVGSVRPGE